MAQTVLAMPNYNVVYDTGITTINDIATLSINSFADSSNQTYNLTVGASSNIEIEANQNTNVTFSDQGSLSLYNFASGDYQNKYKILNINNDSETTIIDAPQMKLQIQGTDPLITTGVSLTSFYIDNDFQKIATSTDGFMFEDYVMLSSNLVVNQDIVGHQNLAIGGNAFSKTMNLYKNMTVQNDTELSQVAFAFFINQYNQLELLKYEKYGTSNITTRQTRMNMWGDASNRTLPGVYDFGSRSNYKVLTEFSGLSSIGNVNSNGLVTGVSGGQSIFQTDSSNVFIMSSNIGIGTTLPQVPLDINGAIRATTYCNLFLDDLTTTSTSNAPSASNLAYVWANTVFLSNSLIPKAAYASNLSVALSNAVFSGAASGGSNGGTDPGTYIMAFSTSNDLYPQVSYAISFGHSLSNAVYSGSLNVRDVYSSNLATTTSNTLYQRSAYACNLSISTSNALYPRSTSASNKSVYASNSVITLSNYVYNLGFSNANGTLVYASNTYLSNMANYASNSSYFASNLIVTSSNTLYPAFTFSSNAATWSSNVIGARSVYASNSLSNTVRISGSTMTGNLIINNSNSSIMLSNNKNTRVDIGVSYVDGEFSTSSKSNDFTIRNMFSGGKILLQQGSNTAGLTINSNNTVGIGTSTPVERLHVSGKIYSTQQFLADSNDSSSVPAFSFMGDSNTGMWQPSNDTLGFVTGGVDRVRIDSQGYVGIGKSNPSSSLDVVGQIKTNVGIVINSSTYTDTILNAWSNTAYFASNNIGNDGSFTSNLAVTSSNTLYPQSTFASNTSVFASNMVMTSSNPQSTFGSNTGVFSSNALSNYLPLAGGIVTGTTSFRSNIILSSNNLIYSTAGSLSISAESFLDLIMDNNSNNVGVDNQTGIRFGYGNSNTSSNFTEYMRLTSVGKLGIGTSNPQSLLDVNGDTRIASNLTVLGNLNISGTTTTIDSTTVNIQDNTIRLNNGAAYNVGLQAGIEVNRGTGYSNYHFIFDEASDYFKVGQVGQLQAVATREDSPIATSIPFYDSANTRYGSSGNFVFSNNNLGVGTSTPSEKLHVVGKVYSTQQFLADSNDSSNAPAFSFMGDSNTGMWQPSNDTIGFVTGGVDRVRITSTGTVGIGTSNPSEALHVVGKVYSTQQFLADSNDTSNFPAFSFMGDPNTGMWQPAENTIGFVTGGVDRVRIDPFGRLGIAIGSPLYPLDVNGISRFSSNVMFQSSNTILTNDSSNSAYQCVITNTNGTTGESCGIAFISGLAHSPSTVPTSAITSERVGVSDFRGKLHFKTKGSMILSDPISTRMTITEAGNIGMNTSNPVELLHVVGKVYSTQQFLADSNDSSNAPAFSFMGNSNTGMWQPSNDTIGFVTGGVDRVRIDSTGNVGIGVSSPTKPLEVNGTATFSSNVITQSTGTVGTQYILHAGFFDLVDTSNTFGFIEPGNPGMNGSMFHQGFFNGSNCSGQNITWTQARLMIRGCTINTNNTPTTVKLNISCFNSNTGSNIVISTMDCKDYGTLNGYTTNISPFFTLSNINMPFIGVQLATSNATYRVGPTSVFFSTE